ncbi:MAG: VanW family protein [Firmicutes bacterium]|nr:VanW family protein [Bacillota bacterium]MCM1401115.1 VanW family protein [Bacteroides sp.]MCM1477062.1 VanW family protein [Bacteroides sp.]
MPGEVFSFWRVVGNPNNPRRFTYGRSLHNGVPVKDYGGGLCQASGIIHHISLMAGLEILERHNHSVDLYTDETRFAPIGTDATVFYGYKDLRVRNNAGFPLRFILNVEEKRLKLTLESSCPINARELVIDCRQDDRGVKSVAIRTTSGQTVSESTYLPLAE